MKELNIISLHSNSIIKLDHLMWLSTIFVFIFLMFRGGGIYPVVFADEWAYSSYSRLHNMQDAGVPSYLYLALYKITNICGDGFLECARVFNGAFIALTMPIIYFTARQLCSGWSALMVAILATIGPSSTYSIYFMPEAMYFFGFWLLTWVALRQDLKSPLFFAFQLGLILGLMSLVKIHALFLLPSMIFYILFRVWEIDKNNWYKLGTVSALITVLSFSATKLVVGFLYAGKAGINVLGSLYSSHAQTVVLKNDFIELLINTAINLSGHVMALALMFGLPIAIILHSILQKNTEQNISKTGFFDLIVYTALILIPLLFITSYFAASVAGSGPYENIGRLHMRYYNFALPLFYLIAIAQLNVVRSFGRSLTIITLFVALITLIGFWYLIPKFLPSMVDSPELRGFTSNVKFYWIFAFASLMTTIGWFYFPRKSAIVFVYFFMPSVILFGSWKVTEEVRARQITDEYDEAGQFARRYLGSSTSNLAVIAPNPAGLLRTLFHIDNLKTKIVQLEIGSSINTSILPSDVNWILLIGDYNIPGFDERRFSLGKFAFVPLTKNYHIDFKKATWPGVISKTKGLSHAENWGTWSIGPEVTLELSSALPKKFRLTLDAQAFNPNLDNQFNIIIGSVKYGFYLKTEPESLNFEFSLPTNEREIRILIPKPTSPNSIGSNTDTREIGIGLRDITITSIN